MKFTAGEDIEAGDAVTVDPITGTLMKLTYKVGWEDPREMTPERLTRYYHSKEFPGFIFSDKGD